MFDFSTGIVIGYVLLAIFLAWSIIATKGHYVYKCLGIFVLVYYVLVIHFSQNNIMGWPLEADLPASAKIISVRIIEPNDNHEGGMWFWLNEKPQLEQDIMNMLQPSKMFAYTGSVQPRSYKIPYDRELHKKLFEKQKQTGKGGRFLSTGKKGVKSKNNGEQGQDTQDPPFIIINPIEILQKNR